MLRLTVIPLIAVLLVVVLVFAVRSGAEQPAVIAANATVSTLTPITNAVEAPSSTPGQDAPLLVPSPQPTADPAILAIVNDKMIMQADLDEAAAVDRAMSALAGRDPTPIRLVLEQLVNGEVVWQASQMAGAPLADVQIPLAAILATSTRTERDLDAALDNEGLERTGFDAFFARLMTVDQFARREAKRLGTKDDAYLRELQRAAHISFGQRAGEILADAFSTEPAAASFVATDLPIAVSGNAIDARIAPTGVVTATAPPPSPAATRGTEPGQLSPGFQLAALNSPTDTLRLDDFLGKPLVLSFWTTWCPYCLRQTPIMVDAEHRYAVDGIQFAGVNVQESRDTVTPYLMQHGIGYPILLDQDGAVAGLYAVSGYPTTYFLAADGRIVARHIGALSVEQLTGYAEQLLRVE